MFLSELHVLFEFSSLNILVMSILSNFGGFSMVLSSGRT